MTNPERKVCGALLQVLGGAVAAGSLIVMSLVVGLALRIQPQASTMLGAYGVVGSMFFAGIATIGWGGWVLDQARRNRCPRCEYELYASRVEGCPECGWHHLLR